MARNSGIGAAGAHIAILSDAVKASDQEDVERWLIGYNPMLAAGDFGRLPVGTVRADDGGTEKSAKKALGLPDALPATWLPATAGLAAQARSAPMAALLAGLAAWAAKGRPVTRKDELPAAAAADAASWLGVTPDAMGYLWQYALAGRWIEKAGGAVEALAVPGRAAADWGGGDEETLRAWHATLAAVLARALDLAAALDPAGPGTLNFQGQGSLAAVRLFLARGDGGLPAGRVRDLIMQGAVGDLAWAGLRRQLDERARSHADPARALIDHLAQLRAVEASPAGEGWIRLAPLALGALGAELSAAGVDVPVVQGDLARMSAAALAAVHGGLLDPEFSALADRWVAARGPARAASALLEYAAGARPAGRLAMVGVVRGMAEQAASAWRDALKRPELRPYARIELARLASQLGDSTIPLVLEPGPDDLTWLAADLLALACGADDPDPDLIAARFRAAVPAGEEEWIFEQMSQGTHPDVVRVLTVLGRHHPDRRIARDARKAAQRASALRASKAGGGREG
ncbi:MAG: hypothetical protein JWM19_3578 [Actinomycetia bacterium]|nr:hypothetical protein [Actinomycetes bacterium]